MKQSQGRIIRSSFSRKILADWSRKYDLAARERVLNFIWRDYDENLLCRVTGCAAEIW